MISTIATASYSSSFDLANLLHRVHVVLTANASRFSSFSALASSSSARGGTLQQRELVQHQDFQLTCCPSSKRTSLPRINRARSGLHSLQGHPFHGIRRASSRVPAAAARSRARSDPLISTCSTTTTTASFSGDSHFSHMNKLAPRSSKTERSEPSESSSMRCI